MKATNKRHKRPIVRAISVGGLDRALVAQLRADAKANHRSLAGHIRALLENAINADGDIGKEAA
jgi:hypothetical protein